MCDLYLEHYDGSSSSLFYRDLDEKTEVLILYHDAVVVGFSTLLFYSFRHEGTSVRIVFSGDTVVHQNHWGQQRLHTAWLARTNAWWSQNPEQPLFWFLLVKGHRTYRFLSAGFKRYFPHHEQSEPALRELAYALAAERYGNAFLPEQGIVRFAESHGHLRGHIALPDARQSTRPDVCFFLQANPGYVNGDELVCLCPLRPDNLSAFSARYFLSGPG